MESKPPRTLRLNRETLRELNAPELRTVAGGIQICDKEDGCKTDMTNGGTCNSQCYQLSIHPVTCASGGLLCG